MAHKRADSTPQKIRSLNIGESFSVARVLTLEEAANDTSPQEALSKMRSRINPLVGRLRAENPGSNFRVDSGCILTDDKTGLLVTVAVTRTEGAASDSDADDDDVDI